MLNRHCSQQTNGVRRRGGPRTRCMASTLGSARPVFSFGVISDIQYADIPDGKSFHGVPRYYRNAKVALRRAVQHWKAQGDLKFAVHLGDIIDGYQPKDTAESALDGLLAELDELGKPVYHMLGNHCLYNLPRGHLNQKLGIHEANDGASHSYYSLQPAPGWRVIVLDSYDVSVLGWPQGHPLHEQAVSLLAQNNPNENKNSPDGLEGVERRWVKFGGGVSAAQIDWLRGELQDAAAQGQRCLVMGHLPLMPGSCPNPCLLWNHPEVLSVLRDSGVVVATMAGHTHQNGYLRDEWGIHHLVLPAILETPPGRDCYGRMDVYADRLELLGIDAMMSLKLSLSQQQARSAVLSTA